MRVVIKAKQIETTILQLEDTVFLGYNTGSRDPDHFMEPDRRELNRGMINQHPGFVRGIHAYVGAPVARLLPKIELEVLRHRPPI